MTYTVLRILTYVLGITGSALLLPVAVAMIEGERHMLVPFLIPMAVAWGLAAVFWLKVREKPKVIGIQDAFSVVGILWIAICFFGAVPLYFSGAFPTFTDAMFESVSGFTTTGATVLADVESLPSSLNIWRCETHWLGGMVGPMGNYAAFSIPAKLLLSFKMLLGRLEIFPMLMLFMPSFWNRK